MTEQDQRLPEINASTPHPARMYDYFLGGKDNFPADRKAAEAILTTAPEARDLARQNRAFLQRAVRFLAGEAGIRQFLDIGTGIPTQGNVHEIAHAVAPDARVVYVDIDPIVLTHGRALLASPNTTIVLGDLREPAAILADAEVRRMIDFDQPVAVLLVAILHFVRDEEGPAEIAARLRDAMAPGSYLTISHGTADFQPEHEATTTVVRTYDRATSQLSLRSHAEIARFFDGFELVEPGLVPVSMWRPDSDIPEGQGVYAGVGRKP
ncbi:MAG TPA: SAM-dependent methyltransferase [Actinomycetes bacterium]|jgi:hypothetical protein|nr:SAM-dependent methyltransferase [Actinomycetes bacterium]